MAQTCTHVRVPGERFPLHLTRELFADMPRTRRTNVQSAESPYLILAAYAVPTKAITTAEPCFGTLLPELPAYMGTGSNLSPVTAGRPVGAAQEWSRFAQAFVEWRRSGAPCRNDLPRNGASHHCASLCTVLARLLRKDPKGIDVNSQCAVRCAAEWHCFHWHSFLDVLYASRLCKGLFSSSVGMATASPKRDNPLLIIRQFPWSSSLTQRASHWRGLPDIRDVRQDSSSALHRHWRQASLP